MLCLILRYIRELTVQNRDNCVFISCDDKAKVEFGEPGTVVSSRVRGKKSIIPTSSSSFHHDFNQKGWYCKFTKCKKYFKERNFSRDLLLRTFIICPDFNRGVSPY